MDFFRPTHPLNLENFRFIFLNPFPREAIKKINSKLREGFKKKNYGKIPYRVLTPPSPPVMEKKLFFFSETRPFLSSSLLLSICLYL